MKRKDNNAETTFTRTACRYALCAGAAAMLLTGCATRDKTPKQDVFTDHWKAEAIDRQGFSPAEEDLDPEPRVLVTQSDPGTAQVRALPTKPITLKLQNANVETVLRAMAQAADVSLMMPAGIQGTTSIAVRNARWSDVFNSILQSNGLDYRWQGKILQILTAAEKQKEVGMMTLNNQLAEQYQNASHAGPLTVRVVNIRYSDAAALAKSLQKFIARNKDAVIDVDEHNNALVIQGTASEQARLLALVDRMDRPRPQVQLKAYIVETTKEKARELGMQWGAMMRTGTWGNKHAWLGTGGSKFDGNVTAWGNGTDNLAAAPMGLDYSSIVGSSGAGSLGLAFGKLGANMLETQLNLMEKEGVLNILSSPSITTLDNKMAYTENGERVPYVSTNKDGDNDVKWEDAVLRLEMTPNVIDRANMKLKVLIKKDEVDMSRKVDGNPFIVKKQTETTVIVRSGETIVISGLTKEKGNNAEAGVPGARDLPGGKYVFGSTAKNTTMEEVLIFITPVILPTRTVADRHVRPLGQSPRVLQEPEKHRKVTVPEAKEQL